MKSTGIVRKVDELGRIVLPKELRNLLNIKERDPLEIFMDGDKIVLKKYDFSCLFCSGTDNMSVYNEKHICESCLANLKKL